MTHSGYAYTLGVWPLQLRLRRYRLAPRRTTRDTLLLNVQGAKSKTLLDADLHLTWTNTALLATPSCYGQDIMDAASYMEVHVVTLGA